MFLVNVKQCRQRENKSVERLENEDLLSVEMYRKKNRRKIKEK